MYAYLNNAFEKTRNLCPLRSMRQRFWDQFNLKGMPNKQMPGYQYINSVNFSESAFNKVNVDTSPLNKSLEGPTLVFHDASFSKESSSFNGLPPNIIIDTLSRSYKTYGSHLNQHFLKSLKEESDPLVMLNFALHKEALFIYLPPKTIIENPIKIIFNTSNAPSFPKVILFAGKESKADLYVIHQGFGNHFTSDVIDIVLDDMARVSLFSEKEKTNASLFSFVRAHLKRDSYFKSLAFFGNQVLEKADYKVSLNGENANAELFGLGTLNESSACHINVFMQHISPYTSSKQHFKSVLSDLSKASFEGRIYVHKEAMKTDAFQLNNYLLLSPHVIANSKPNLEIFADDVKASHGATIGQLDLESLFYLKSRGIKEEMAQKLLVEGFVNEIKQLKPDI
jgi:Fe-S cluster assembly protein SufD